MISMRQHLITVLICVSLMTSDAEHLPVCLLATPVSPLEKCLSKSFVHFFIWDVCFVVVEFQEFSR